MNRIFTEQLAASLNNRLQQIYYLVGQDPLLLSESADLIWKVANQQGFDEKIEADIDNNTDWDDLLERCQSLGLFFNKQIIYLNLPENLTVALQSKLDELISLINEDLLFVFQMAKFPKTAEKQAWVKKSLEFEPHLVLVNCQTPTIEQLPKWLTHRTKNMGMNLEQDAIQFLCYSHENNLLALKQSLDLLFLLHQDKKLSLQKVQQVVEQSSIFTPFQWIDALLEGKFQRAKRVLQGLKMEDVQPVVLLRIFQRELMIMLELSKPQQSIADLTQKLPVEQLRQNFDRMKIWQNRRTFYVAAFQRLTYQRLYLIIQQLAEIERQTKMDFSADSWSQLTELSAQFCA
ncbi:DNA polymerase III subunit delta [Pasteurellaceae bacterium 22721_9_1]